MRLEAWQVVLGVVGLALALVQARHGGIGVGRRSRLEQRLKHLSELLDKLPRNAYGRKKIGDLIQHVSYELAYLLEFPRVTSQLATGASSVSAAIIGVYGAWLMENRPTTPIAVTNLLSASVVVALHIYMTSDINSRMLTDRARDLFEYVNGEPGLYRVDVRPGIFLIHYQPYTSDVEARAQEIAETRQIPLAQATAQAWSRARQEMNARCRWYHRFVWTRLPLEFFAWLGEAPLVPYDRDRNPYESQSEPSGQPKKA
ncbi:Uncharacterised protein [Mycobacteroides abscessus subsp. bolletii]|nr:Uncharacterised protein [Mycobacteroides abscessus subsp. bolletii]SKP82878.1 Uncharacterised protein [Mycobacteroides abscessus subsp. bolletii]SKP99265.1 Uncharacterised protein [Mycobacteroides abscessus subsp. bolletii]SKQ16876.1 Uncharacterised protein [Mycobacteroides abscessus subsp. bolletii]